MRKAIIYLSAIFSLFILFVFPSRFTSAEEQSDASAVQFQYERQSRMEDYQGPTLTISGKVVFPGHKQGQLIRIIVFTPPTKTKESTLVAIKDLSQPGDYSVEVPRSLGNAYLTVVPLEPAEEGPIGYRPIRGLGRSSKLIKGSHSDIKGVNVTIGEGEPSSPRMEDYQGPTLTISGKVVFPGHKQGQLIRIIVFTPPTKTKESTLVAIKDLSQPGDYSVEVPRSLGNAYLTVVPLEPAEEGPIGYRPIRGLGRSSKLIKGSHSDIKGVNVTIGEGD